jgi:hypothetical protein
VSDEIILARSKTCDHCVKRNNFLRDLKFVTAVSREGFSTLNFDVDILAGLAKLPKVFFFLFFLFEMNPEDQFPPNRTTPQLPTVKHPR